ncbi:hypothetical protein K438DRAFT_920363 [Mycena galopus ATCC 62051]|nr:hypothetical protein K438DRAFT_920363 [Mycena galopus ATCC 62051]
MLRAASSTKSTAALHSCAAPKHSRAAPKHSQATPKRAHATPKRALTTPSPPVPLYLDDTPPPTPPSSALSIASPTASQRTTAAVSHWQPAPLSERKDGVELPPNSPTITSVSSLSASSVSNFFQSVSCRISQPHRAAIPSSSLSAAHSSSTGAESVVKDEETEDTGHFFYNESTRRIFCDA